MKDKKKRIEWTVKEEEFILKGLTPKEVAEKTGKTVAQVYAKKANLTRKKNLVNRLLRHKSQSSIVPRKDRVPNDTLRFVVSGVEINIQASARNILVSKDSIKIDF
jgi:hypothetical protein